MKAVCRRKGDIATVALSGELDHFGAQSVIDKLRSCAEDETVAALVVDMSKVTFMDSSGIGALLGRYKTMKGRGAKMTIKSPGEEIYRLLRMAGMSNLVERN